jgi:hypothetical protein
LGVEGGFADQRTQKQAQHHSHGGRNKLPPGPFTETAPLDIVGTAGVQDSLMQPVWERSLWRGLDKLLQSKALIMINPATDTILEMRIQPLGGSLVQVPVRQQVYVVAIFGTSHGRFLFQWHLGGAD